VPRKGKPITEPHLSPYIWESGDYLSRVIRIVLDYNDQTRAITGATVVRDEGCVYTRIIIGLGPDGTPDSSPKQFDVPAGSTPVTKQQISTVVGVDTVEQFQALQITAAPPAA
jgi:hypothetical protein